LMDDGESLARRTVTGGINGKGGGVLDWGGRRGGRSCSTEEDLWVRGRRFLRGGGLWTGGMKRP